MPKKVQCAGVYAILAAMLKITGKLRAVSAALPAFFICAMLLGACTGGGSAEERPLLTIGEIPEARDVPPYNLFTAENERRNRVLRRNVVKWNAYAVESHISTLRRARAATEIAHALASCPWAERASALYDKALQSGTAESLPIIRAWQGHGMLVCVVPREVMLFAPIEFSLRDTPPSPDPESATTARRQLDMYLTLNEAVDGAPYHPVTRLLRAYGYGMVASGGGASRYTGGIPGTTDGTGREIMLADLALLARWTENPETNPAHAEYLAGRAWRKMYYYLRARMLANHATRPVKETADSVRAWRNLREITDEESDRFLAYFHMERNRIQRELDYKLAPPIAPRDDQRP